jgi:hypothetical protein
MTLQFLSVKDLSGDAQIVVTRGKKKHVCDYSMKVEWSVLSDGEELLKGVSNVQDITADGDFEVDISLSSSNQSDTLKNKTKMVINSSISAVVGEFIQLFKAK